MDRPDVPRGADRAGRSEDEGDGAGGSDDAVPWRALVAETEQRLARGGIDTAAPEARWLVEEASGYAAGELLTEPALAATVSGVRRLDAMVQRRLGGEPIQYVLGRWSFRTVDLLVDPRVLIPRPETEQVVEVALGVLAGRPSGDPPVAVDLGTGSGAIALAIASEHPRVEVWATDRSPSALDVATANLAGIGRAATRVRIAGGDWFDALPDRLRGSVDLLVSNPPYVPDAAPLPDEVARWEPADALRGGPAGLDAIDRILATAPQWLAPEGVVVLECSPEQATTVAAMAADVGLDLTEVHRDLAGRERAVTARAAVTVAGVS